MRAQFAEIPIVGSYEFLAETTFEGKDDRITRYYRSPLDSGRTCDELEAALRDRLVTRHRAVDSCTFGFGVSAGWLGRITGASTYDVAVTGNPIPADSSPERFRRLRYPGQPREAFTQVSVTFYDR
jgi:hypothetical protein